MLNGEKQGPLTPRKAKPEEQPTTNSALKRELGTMSFEEASQRLIPEESKGGQPRPVSSAEASGSNSSVVTPPPRPQRRAPQLTLRDELATDTTGASYEAYTKRHQELNGAIQDAHGKTGEERRLGLEAFEKRELDEVSKQRRKEADAYPCYSYNGFEFRHLAMGDEHDPALTREDHAEKAERGDTHPLGQLKGVDISDGHVWFYKAVKGTQLDAIRNGGLDAKYGGLGGATEAAGEGKPEALAAFQERDRGKTYVSPAFDNANDYQKTLKTQSHTLVCKIPLQATNALKFCTDGSHDEWITMGTVIPADYIYVLDASETVYPNAIEHDGRRFVPLSVFGGTHG